MWIALVLGWIAPALQASDAWCLRGGRYFDVERGALVANEGITIRADRIIGLGRPEDSAGVRFVDIDEDHVVLPGFFDLHAHYAVDLFGGGRVDETTVNPLLFLANGVTTTFPAGEVDPERMHALRAAIESGQQAGPRLLNSGPYFGRWRRGWDDARSPASVAAEVDAWSERGVRHFKAKGIGAAHLEALIDAAHEHGATVTGHLGSGYRGSVNPRDAIELGIDRIEHFLGGDALPASRSAYASLAELDTETPEFRAIARLFIDRGVYFDATMSAYGYFGAQDPEVFTPFTDEQRFFTPFVRAHVAKQPARAAMEIMERVYRVKRKSLLAFHDAGGAHLITVGTDHPSWGQYLAAFGYHRELHCLVLAGLTPAAALRCATINGARALGHAGDSGSITVGKLADLVVIAGDPLEDIRATREVLTVVRAGVAHDASDLLRAAEGKLGPLDESTVADWKARR